MIDVSEKRIYSVTLTLIRLFFIVVLPILLALVGLYFYSHGGELVETENAYVKSDVIMVSPELPGRVTNVEVVDNQYIEKGALLFAIEYQGHVVDQEKATAQMNMVRVEVAGLKADHQAAKVERQEVLSHIAFLEKQFKRQQRLQEAGMGRADQYDEALYQLELAKAKLVTLDEKIKKILAGLMGDASLNPEKHPKYLEAKATFDRADLNIKDSFTYAPESGIVSNMKLQKGEFVHKGANIFAIIVSDKVWIEANYKETQLTWMKEGQTVHIEADAYPHLKWQGTVATIAPATGAEFAILPPQNATGNWVKVVQRVPVLIDVNQPEGYPPLRAGMTVTVGVETGVSRGLPGPLRKMVRMGLLPDFLEPRNSSNGDH